MPLKGDTRSMTSDGAPAVNRRFGDLPDVNLGDVLLYHYPTSWNHFMADHAVTFRMLPFGPTRTQLTTTWLVPADAEHGVDYDVDELTRVWTITNAQDTELVERTQRGVQSPAYRPGPVRAGRRTRRGPVRRLVRRAHARGARLPSADGGMPPDAASDLEADGRDRRGR